MATRTIKMCDMPIAIAVKTFEMLNTGLVHLEEREFIGTVIKTDVEPKYLTYPEGWYYKEGCFRNNYQTTNGHYEEMIMIKTNGHPWDVEAKYSTL